jgi:hypothetical protein
MPGCVTSGEGNPKGGVCFPPVPDLIDLTPPPVTPSSASPQSGSRLRAEGKGARSRTAAGPAALSPSPSLPSSLGPLIPQSLTPFARECVAFFSEAVQVFGVPKSVGQIYGLLFASPVPLSFSDIAAGLAISKGSASQGLQLLRSLGAVVPLAPSDSTNRLSDGAVARIVYEPELSLRKLMSGVLQERVAPLAAAGRGRLARLQELAAEGGKKREFFLDRVGQLENWRRRLKTVLPVLGALLGPKRRK